MSRENVPVLEKTNIRHIAFIMDGNGRWAKKRGMPREYGHKFGAQAFKKVMEHCCRRDIEATTFYVFSTENWNRPKNEVDSIMNLLSDYLDDCEKQLSKYDIRFVFLGDKSVFTDKLRRKMEYIESSSAKNKYIVNLALNYGGRDELVTACNKLIKSGKQVVTEDDVTSSLYTAASPELDLIVRTGGDMRLSNFLLWQAAYAELYFTDKLWPDFSEEDVDLAIDDFNNRKRRFGGV